MVLRTAKPKRNKTLRKIAAGAAIAAVGVGLGVPAAKKASFEIKTTRTATRIRKETHAIKDIQARRWMQFQKAMFNMKKLPQKRLFNALKHAAESTGMPPEKVMRVFLEHGVAPMTEVKLRNFGNVEEAKIVHAAAEYINQFKEPQRMAIWETMQHLRNNKAKVVTAKKLLPKE